MRAAQASVCPALLLPQTTKQHTMQTALCQALRAPVASSEWWRGLPTRLQAPAAAALACENVKRMRSCRPAAPLPLQRPRPAATPVRLGAAPLSACLSQQSAQAALHGVCGSPGVAHTQLMARRPATSPPASRPALTRPPPLLSAPQAAPSWCAARSSRTWPLRPRLRACLSPPCWRRTPLWRW